MNEERFVGKADVYAQYRPTYPEAFIEYLYGEVGFREDSTIADIGAGTGKFAELLARRGSSLVCVEPNGEMLRKAAALLGRFESVRMIPASAEHTGLEPRSVDFVTAAQAFHWFDRGKFRRECRRILKDGGKAVLVWNRRDESHPAVIKNAAINRRLCPQFAGFTGGFDPRPDAFADFFRSGTCRHRDFAFNVDFDEEGFVGRCLSGSYAPTPDSAHCCEYVEAIRELFAEYAENNVLSIPHITRSYVGEPS